MDLWQRRVVGLLGVGGGSIGLLATVSVLAQQSSALAWLLSLVFITLYSWGIWCGLRMLEGAPGAERANLKFWLAQVPVLSSPVVGYFFANGFHLTITLQASPLKLNANFLLGSTFNYSLLDPSKPFVIGINVFALSVALWLLRQIRRQLPNNSFKADASGAA